MTDEDRATAVSILSSLTSVAEAPAAQLRATILAEVRNPAVAAELGRIEPGPKGRFEVYRDAAGGYRWRLKSAAGQYLAGSEGHSSQAAALSSLELARRELGNEATDPG